MTTITIALLPRETLNANQRMHWAAKARLTASIRARATIARAILRSSSSVSSVTGSIVSVISPASPPNPRPARQADPHPPFI